ncbi:MAG: methylmalonyl-CoA mutase family protein [Bacteroidota bacterium]|nr:methylmalonyl-CoA mutase small subunit [Odoribacter sp.]MDP3643369.1 methylmalonyl-CoA mutase family protein [Bacteroidota bacterium]
MAEKYIGLFEEFPPVSTQQWMDKVTADLKGADYNKKLVWKTNEGIDVQPFYREENLEKLDYLNSLPGEFPFVRGNKKNNNGWLVRQSIPVIDLAEANKKALTYLMKGVDSLAFEFKESGELTFADLAILLKDIQLEAVEVNFAGNCCSRKVAEAFTEFVKQGSWDPKTIRASVEYDPFGKYALTGKFRKSQDHAIENVIKMIRSTTELSKFRTLAVNGKNFGNAGSTIVQELAYSLALGAEYLTALTDGGSTDSTGSSTSSPTGLTVDAVAKKMKFNLSISANYFLEIAKLRAGRLLWAQIVKAYNPECECSCKMIVHAETGTWNKTVYDPYVNALRTQTEAMSASLGGADSITVLPFNAIYEDSTWFSDRIARNQQLLLKEEANFDKIADPGAGSYYIEELTAAIADQAWKLFLEVQDKGGFLAALREGFIQAEIKKMAGKRDLNIATRRESLLGTNQFPNFNEKLDQEMNPAVFAPVDLTSEGAEIETLKPYRGAQAFEALRYKTDVFARTNKRPLAFMMPIGNLNMRKARAQFACNFFAVAGFDVLDNNGFKTVEEGWKAAQEAGAQIVVLCSSDDEYTEFAPVAFEAVAGKAIFVVAGAPANMDELKAKGIANYINVKSNLLEELKAYQSKLL